MLVPCTRKAWATNVMRKKQKSTATERSCSSSHSARQTWARAPCARRRHGQAAVAGQRAATRGFQAQALPRRTTRVPAMRSCSARAAERDHQEPYPEQAAPERL